MFLHMTSKAHKLKIGEIIEQNERKIQMKKKGEELDTLHVQLEEE